MGPSELPDIDTAVEEALRERPARHAPPGLYQRIRKRLAIVRLIQVERKRFRYVLAAGLCLVLGAIGVGALMSVLLVRDVPGGMGYFDYLKSQILLSLPAVAGVLGFGIALSFGASVWFTLRPTRKSDNHIDDTFAL